MFHWQHRCCMTSSGLADSGVGSRALGGHPCWSEAPGDPYSDPHLGDGATWCNYTWPCLRKGLILVGSWIKIASSMMIIQYCFWPKPLGERDCCTTQALTCDQDPSEYFDCTFRLWKLMWARAHTHICILYIMRATYVMRSWYVRSICACWCVSAWFVCWFVKLSY